MKIISLQLNVIITHRMIRRGNQGWSKEQLRAMMETVLSKYSGAIDKRLAKYAPSQAPVPETADQDVNPSFFKYKPFICCENNIILVLFA